MGKDLGGPNYDDGTSISIDDGGIYDSGMFASLNCNFDPAGTDLHSAHGTLSNVDCICQQI